MKLYLLLIPLLAAMACAPSVSQDEYDGLSSDFRQSQTEVSELKSQLNTAETKLSELEGQVEELTDLQVGLRERLDIAGREKQTIERVKEEPTAVSETSDITVQEAFPDIFQNAAQVDIISNEDFFSCDDYSTYEVREGDQITFKVLLVRNEDSLSEEMGLRASLKFFKN